jgi:hypothetical protein
MDSQLLARATPATDFPVATQDSRLGRIREWLLLLLRFAVTRDSQDEAAAHALADQIDAVGLQSQLSAPTFFHRTTLELCNAVTAPERDPQRQATLARHLSRIDDARLKRAFAAAVDFRKPKSGDGKREGLWTGL